MNIFPDWTFQVRPYLVVEGEGYGVVAVVVVVVPACPGHSVLALSEAPHGAGQSDRLAQGRRQVPADRPGNVSNTAHAHHQQAHCHQELVLIKC